ncbi:MAG: ABC-type multidrug transport system fused ATPase/permease subunit [Oleiphilaceae bacterium]|jgi:ABC-type multidrug transport system fused ATPase/permease subunit
MVLASFAEMVSIGAALPFLGVLTAPERIFEHQLMQPLIRALELTEASQIVLPLTLVFVFVALVSGVIRLTLLYVMIRLSFATGADFSIDIYRRTLYQEYSIHVSRNSSEVINGIINKTNIVIHSVIAPVLSLISSIILLIGVMVALLTIDFAMAATAFISFGFIYWVILRFTRQHLAENSQCVANESSQMIKSLQEGLGGIRDVLVDGTQEYYCKIYRNADIPLRRAQGNNRFISASPRYALEVLGITLISGLAYMMTQRDGGVIAAIPLLGALALGAQRLLPALQLAYASLSTIKGSKVSLVDVLDLLDQPMPVAPKESLAGSIKFQQHINLNNLSFRYAPSTPWILQNINYTLKKGSRIGFMGVTGSGKSTMIDILMGLLAPTEGTLEVDGQLINTENRRAWQSHIAHVPQNIYLSDSSIAENIAFGLPQEKINFHRVQQAAQQAQIGDLIESWPEKYSTFVGERGIRLSGGQRQRIGIARALYKQADVIIFDEATSALDNETEQAVMNSIESLGNELTIIIIAHRLTTLKECDHIVEVGNNHILRIGKYDELIK